MASINKRSKLYAWKTLELKEKFPCGKRDFQEIFFKRLSLITALEKCYCLYVLIPVY